MTLPEFEAFVKKARELGVEAFELGELKVTFARASNRVVFEEVEPPPDGKDEERQQRENLRELLNAEAPQDGDA